MDRLAQVENGSCDGSTKPNRRQRGTRNPASSAKERAPRILNKENCMAEPRTTDSQDVPNQAANKEKAEGSRANVESGITNRPIEEEQKEQQSLPPRGQGSTHTHGGVPASEPSRAAGDRDAAGEKTMPSDDSSLRTKI
jgi:hypothetical protein